MPLAVSIPDVPLRRSAASGTRQVAVQRTADQPRGATAPELEPATVGANSDSNSVAVVQAAPAATTPAAETIQRVPAMPLAPAPAPTMTMAAPAAAIQRAEAVSSEQNTMTVSPGEPESTETSPDIDELSEKVWRKLENRIRVERERQFGLP